MPKKTKIIEFNASGFLKNSYLDKFGSKMVTFEFSAESALEIAKLELMGRDLKNHLPVLLEIHVKQAKENKECQEVVEGPARKIRRPGSVKRAKA